MNVLSVVSFDQRHLNASLQILSLIYVLQNRDISDDILSHCQRS